ncbi:hypothetical protein [Enterobacter phage vB_ExiM_F5M1E]|nr:hypothetical protein [Enterobacter phage vB_ExiM_F1M1E]UNA03227.1 hypothetical protein [Enterobacter phage vB_ExiM_F2M1E]UNA03547.1 hypothetical protein [Enterobacter phage vB_ExiM_F4M1E]UNA03868.1 hypothetical protein [Enterobacter phage vB_ExiM_F5M1E]UNA04188.1 hypothetical protein [Pantoea phage vB_PdiM_F5M2A]
MRPEATVAIPEAVDGAAVYPAELNPNRNGTLVV